MSRWAETFSAHAIHGTLDKMKGFINVEPKEVDEQLASELSRILKVINLIKDLLATIDPELVPSSLLSNINSQLKHQNCLQQLSSYSQNGALNHLQAANDHIDSSVFPILPQLIALKGDKLQVRTDKERADVLDKFVSKAKSERTELEADFKSQADAVATLTAQAQSLKTTIDQLEQQQSTQMETWRSEFEKAEAERSTSFSGGQATRQSAFKEWFTSAKEDAEKELSDQFANFASDIEAKLGDANVKHNEILGLHKLVAGDSVAAGYLNDGKTEKGQADRWRWISVAFIVATVLWLGFAFYLNYEGKEPDTDPWIGLIRTASLTGVLLFGAAYASRQSKAHRDQERRARWFGLEMKALDPYVDSLDPEQQKALKEKLAERFFGQRPTEPINTPAQTDNEILKVLVGLVSKLSDR